MSTTENRKTIAEINEKIRSGEVVVMTAEEIIDAAKKDGAAETARRVDVVTTGTFAPMCSSGAFFNFGQQPPTIKASNIRFNDVPAYGGVAAVDGYLGVTEPRMDDPLNKVPPGAFPYGGGHVIEDLAAGKTVRLTLSGYGTACYPKTSEEREITLADLPYALLCNPRNAYQNYNCAVNVGKKTIHTYMGTLKPRLGNANYCSAGALSPLMNDPYYKTIGMGTRIFLGGGVGYVAWPGTQHKPGVPRTVGGTPVMPAGTLFVMGDLKQMNPRYLRGVSLLGYGCSLAVGLGVPIPLLTEEIARFTAVSNEEIFTQVVDYSHDYPNGVSRSLGQVSYAELMSGVIRVNGEEVQTAPLSSIVRAREIAETLKSWIQAGSFLLTEPVFPLPSV